MMKSVFLSIIFLSIISIGFSQATNPANDPEAAALLQKVSEKYKGYKNISAEFKLLIQKPKVKPNDDERKLTDTLSGQIVLQGTKFSINMKGQKIICDGKNIWTYIAADKEVQVNHFEESDDIFSPSKIFSLYREGYMYQINEKKILNGRKVTVVSVAPVSKKVSYFRIDVTVDDETSRITESKILEKNGVHYVYQLSKQTSNTTVADDGFTFDKTKYPGVKVVDLR